MSMSIYKMTCLSWEMNMLQRKAQPKPLSTLHTWLRRVHDHWVGLCTQCFNPTNLLNHSCAHTGRLIAWRCQQRISWTRSHLCVSVWVLCQSSTESTSLMSRRDREITCWQLSTNRRQHPLAEEWWWKPFLLPTSCLWPQRGGLPSRLTEHRRLSCPTQWGELACKCVQTKAWATGEMVSKLHHSFHIPRWCRRGRANSETAEERRFCLYKGRRKEERYKQKKKKLN